MADMIRARLRDRMILIHTDEQDTHIASRFPGAMKNKRMPPNTWELPLTCESIRQLRAAKAVADSEFRDLAKWMLAAERFVDEHKQAEDIEPICPVVIRPEYALYRHQIRGYNIALALMGYDTKGGDVNE